MLEAACQEAESVLLDRRYFVLSEAEFQRFTEQLDKPPATNARLERLLRTKAQDQGAVGKVNPGDLQFSAPEKLTASHEVSHFDCGEPILDRSVKMRSLQNEDTGASRTYGLRAGQEVAGYYALATEAIARAEAATRIRRNMPDPCR